jgi:hypothetical protein
MLELSLRRREVTKNMNLIDMSTKLNNIGVKLKCNKKKLDNFKKVIKDKVILDLKMLTTILVVLIKIGINLGVQIRDHLILTAIGIEVMMKFQKML